MALLSSLWSGSCVSGRRGAFGWGRVTVLVPICPLGDPSRPAALGPRAVRTVLSLGCTWQGLCAARAQPLGLTFEFCFGRVPSWCVRPWEGH